MLLVREGRNVNVKCTYRIYREEGLSVRRRKRKHVAVARQPMRTPVSLNDCWAMDFMSDSLTTGRRFRVLNVVDVLSREGLVAEADTSLPAKRVIQALEEVALERGYPKRISVDIGTNPSSAGKVLVIYRGDPTIASNELVQVFNNGEFTINGHLTVTGGKSAIVPTHLGMTKVYSQESPEVWFEDFGSGRLQSGQAEIRLDATFLETVTIDRRHPLKVFVALEGECEGVYVLPGMTAFTVRELRHGHSNAPFTYRVVAKRKGFEDVRLEPDQAVANVR